MGGTPRGKDKPRPSYEDGELRDPSIEEKQDSTYSRGRLFDLIGKAVRPRSAIAEGAKRP